MKKKRTLFSLSIFTHIFGQRYEMEQNMNYYDPTSVPS